MPAPSYRHDLAHAIRRWLPPQAFARWPLRAGLRWAPQRLAWVALLMAWSAEQTLGERFGAALALLAALFPRWRRRGGYTGFAAALRRWSAALRPAVAARLRREMPAAAGRHWLRGGRCAFACDGSRFECPRTAANEKAFGRAGRKGSGPQLYLTALWHMGLGVPWDFRVGPGTASERRHLEDMLADLPAGALVVADAGFSGYDLYRRLLGARRSFLLRVGSNVHLLQRLGYAQREGRDTVYLWPQARRGGPPVVLRLIVLRRGKEQVHLVTDVLDEAELPAAEAALLYELRWGAEVFFRSAKQTLQRRRMLSRSPAAAREELAWAVLGVWLLGLMTAAAVAARGGDPLAWSAALARRRVRQAMREAAAGRAGRRPLAGLLAAAVQDGYARHRPKRARDWPHKKREKPPGAPEVREATAQEVGRAQRLRQKQAAGT
jgi:Transposase DDE domain